MGERTMARESFVARREPRALKASFSPRTRKFPGIKFRSQDSPLVTRSNIPAEEVREHNRERKVSRGVPRLNNLVCIFFLPIFSLFSSAPSSRRGVTTTCGRVTTQLSHCAPRERCVTKGERQLRPGKKFTQKKKKKKKVGVPGDGKFSVQVEKREKRACIKFDPTIN